MNEKKLMKISLIGTLAGFIVLYILIQTTGYSHTEIGDINKNYIGKVVNVTGKVSGLKIYEDGTFFTLTDKTDSIKVILWSDTIKLLEEKNINASEITNNRTVQIVGEVELYKGELEIIPLRGQIKII
jgi:RecJ-like exonuclease